MKKIKTKMPMYKQINDDTLILSQQAIYGSSRLGVLEREEVVSVDSSLHPPTPTPTIPDPLTENVTHWSRGHKRYELTNHLGNVLATVSDRKLPVYQNGSFHHYKAEVMTANDYYAFGAQMPKRGFDTSDYRFAFGGHEKDNEVHGEGNWYTFGDYGYDPRIVQRPRRDPLDLKYPYLSPYATMMNNPILFLDNTGKEGTLYFTVITDKGTSNFKVVNDKAVALKLNGYYGTGGNGMGETHAWVVNDIKQNVTIDLRGGGLDVKISEAAYSNSKQNLFSLLGDAKLSGDGYMQNGGFYLTSEDGGADPTKAKSENNAREIRNADDLVSLVGGYSTMDKADPSKVKNLRTAIEETVKALSTGIEGADKVMETGEKTFEVGKDMYNQSKENKYCPTCKRTFDGKTGNVIPTDNLPKDTIEPSDHK